MDVIAGCEIVEIDGEALLAFPRGRHAALRARPPKACVCVPVCGDGGALPETLDAIAAQTFGDLAIVVVDDASHDDAFQAACRFADQHPHAVAFQHPRAMGRIPTWNHALDLAVGEVAKLLSPGVQIASDFVAHLVAVMDGDPDLALVSAAAIGDPAAFDASGELTGTTALIAALTGDDAAGPVDGQLFRRAIVEGSHLRFRADVGSGAVFEWALRLLARGDFAYAAEPLWSPAQPPAPVAFVDASEARLSALRDLPRALEPVVIVRTIERVTAMYHDARRAADLDEADPRPLDRSYARALEELALHLQRAIGDLAPATQPDGGVRPPFAHLLAQADADARAQHYQAAEVPIRRILAAEPWNVEALNELGVLRAHQADLVGARKYLLSVLALDPSNPLAREHLAQLAAA